MCKESVNSGASNKAENSSGLKYSVPGNKVVLDYWENRIRVSQELTQTYETGKIFYLRRPGGKTT